MYLARFIRSVGSLMRNGFAAVPLPPPNREVIVVRDMLGASLPRIRSLTINSPSCLISLKYLKASLFSSASICIEQGWLSPFTNISFGSSVWPATLYMNGSQPPLPFIVLAPISFMVRSAFCIYSIPYASTSGSILALLSVSVLVVDEYVTGGVP